MTRFPPSRRASAPIAALLALGAGMAGLLASQRSGGAIPLLLGSGLAAVVLAVALGLPPAEGGPLRGPSPPPRKPWQRAWLLVGAALTAVLLLAALRRFEGPEARPATAWGLYLGGLVALLVSVLPWRGAAPPGRPRISRKELIGLALALALGAAFRLHRITTTPYGVWFDEAQNALEAHRILSQPGYRPVFVAGWSQMPALAFYYYTPFVKALGQGVLPLRLATTLVGLAALVGIWWLGRELFGPREGLVAAALLALSRWHVDFSRFAVAQVFMTLVPALVLALFVRSQRARSPRGAVLCGVVLGIGLQLYYAMAMLPAVLVLTLLWVLARARYRGSAAPGLLALTLVAAACADAPVLQYAFRHPAEYGQRLRDTAIVKAGSPSELLETLLRPSPRRGEAWAAVGRSLLRHARMFHLEGDANGRHNLPGAPMLDPVSGLLFAIGLLWCLARFVEPRSAMLLLWLGAMMAAGVLSLDFEAPQGARTLGATTVIALMAALPLARLSRALEGGPDALPGLGLAVAALLLGTAAVSSWRTYFGQQVSDPAVWAAWSTPETKIAEVVRDEGQGADVYVPAELLGGPTETLILGRPLVARPFERGRDLPLEPTGRRALVFFGGHEMEAVRLLRRFYPDGRLEPFGPPRPDGSRGDPILWIARLPASQIAALGGWLIEFPGSASPPRPTHASAWSWGEAPLSPPFQARLRGTLRVSQDGPYSLVMSTDADAKLFVDGELLLAGMGRREAAVPLARGDHEVGLEVDVRRARSATALRWVAPGADGEQSIPADRMFSPELPAGGLLGSYYPDPEWRGEPAYRQIDPQVAFYFHALPLPRPFSIRWSGRVNAAEGGRYTFATSSIDSSAVAVAGRVIAENRFPDAGAEGEVYLEKGWHPIEVRYRARHDYSQVYLYWVPPGRSRELVPQEALRPPGPRGGEPVPSHSSESAPAGESREAPTGEAVVVRSQELGSSGALRLAGTPDGALRILLVGARRIESLSAGNGAPGPSAALRASVKEPSDLAVGPDGRLYLLDAAGAIHVYSATSAYERSIDLRPLAVYNPRGLAVAPGGDLLIADTGGGRVLQCDPAARLLRQVGRLGSGRGELVDPMDVAVDGAGNIVVVDAGNGRIQRFGPDGNAAAAWPRQGSQAALMSPRLDTDAAGRVWVAGGESEEIWRLDAGAAAPLVFRGPPGLRVVGVSAIAPGRLFLLAQAPDRLLELHLP